VRLGARGLVLKGDSPEKLFQAIRTVSEGELAFGDEVAQGILTAMVSETHEERATNLERLSEREHQIALLVARGMKNKDIGRELGISENTVKRHLQSIFSKTGTKDRLELAVLALSDVTNAA
jgi:two-component system nitrate/nitrite response regulator NarP